MLFIHFGILILYRKPKPLGRFPKDLNMIYLWMGIAVIVYCMLSHWFSYTLMKNRILKRKKWDLNICCGNTDGGGINADIVKHKDVPGFQRVLDVYNLPFGDGEFDSVLCSHTIEHVDDPVRFHSELKRVGKEVVIVIPPLYDLTAALNFFEHKVIFLSFKKEHRTLPRFVRLPMAVCFQKRFGQKIEVSSVPLATIFSGLRGRKPKRN